MGVLPSAILIEREVGIETVIHYCCRDRNLLGMLSDILGAHAAGLRNILIITGDPPKMGPYPEATAVFDIDSIGLTNLVYRLNQGRSEEHTSELQSHHDLVCRLLLEKKKNKKKTPT